MINEERHLREEVGDDLHSCFKEWCRGFWAARCQMGAAGIKKRKLRAKTTKTWALTVSNRSDGVEITNVAQRHCHCKNNSQKR
jgi:hypothetical protein